MDTANYLNNIYAKKEEEHQLHIQQHIDTNPIDKHLLKEKEYKAGRNLYLAAFALTLLFVIGRITELMQEHADLEGKIENLKLAVSMSEKNHNSNEKPPAAAAENDSSIEGIEMKSMDLKKKEWFDNCLVFSCLASFVANKNETKAIPPFHRKRMFESSKNKSKL